MMIFSHVLIKRWIFQSSHVCLCARMSQNTTADICFCFKRITSVRSNVINYYFMEIADNTYTYTYTYIIQVKIRTWNKRDKVVSSFIELTGLFELLLIHRRMNEQIYVTHKLWARNAGFFFQESQYVPANESHIHSS